MDGACKCILIWIWLNVVIMLLMLHLVTVETLLVLVLVLVLVFRAKLITIMESPETDKKFPGLTEDTRGPSLVPL